MGSPIILLDSLSGIYSIGPCSGSRLVSMTGNDQDSHFGSVICNRKEKSNALFRQLGLPAPKQVKISREELLPFAQQRIGFPCVVKPANAERGMGVTVGIKDSIQLKAAFNNAKLIRDDVLIEEHVSGKDHRITVIDGQLRYAICRDPPSIIGNGIASARHMISQENKYRQQKRELDGVSGQIAIDTESSNVLPYMDMSLMM